MSVLDRVVTTILYSNAKLNWETGTFDTICLCNNYYYFELIEDEIDIDNIEELKSVTNNIYGNICMMFKINELVQAVKQINKKVEELGWK